MWASEMFEETDAAYEDLSVLMYNEGKYCVCVWAVIYCVEGGEVPFIGSYTPSSRLWPRPALSRSPLPWRAV